MIVTWMVAAMLFAALLGIAAHAMEAAARLFSHQGRAPWAAALTATIVWPLALPLLARLKVVQLPPIVVDGGAVRSVAARLPAIPNAIASRVDTIAIALWALASIVLLFRLLRAQRALQRISHAARVATIDGHDVLVTSDIGPAVVGIAAPRVAVPLWLTELEAPLRAAVLGVVTNVAIIAACSERVGSNLTGPTQSAGRFVSKQPATAATIVRDNVYQEYQIEHAAAFAPSTGHPRYPDILKQAGVEGQVIASFVVDTTGRADVSTVKILKSTHLLFENAVVAAIPTMRFTPALVGGKSVNQLVTLPFNFQLADSVKVVRDRP